MNSKDGKALLAFLPVEWFVTEKVVGVAHFHDAKFTSDIIAMALHHQVHHTV